MPIAQDPRSVKSDNNKNSGKDVHKTERHVLDLHNKVIEVGEHCESYHTIHTIYPLMINYNNYINTFLSTPEPNQTCR